MWPFKWFAKNKCRTSSSVLWWLLLIKSLPFATLNATLKSFYISTVNAVGVYFSKRFYTSLKPAFAIPLGDQGHSGVSSPQSKHNKWLWLLPLLTKQQLMCIWGRPIVTIFPSRQRQERDVPLMVWIRQEEGKMEIQLSVVSAHSISTS